MTAIDIATYIVDLCIRDDNPVTNLQLQKILCDLNYAYKEKTGKLLFFENIVEGSCFDYIPNVYYHYAHYGVLPITRNGKIIVLPPEIREFIKHNLKR